MASSPETVITFNPTRLDNHGAITEITTSGTTIGIPIGMAVIVFSVIIMIVVLFFRKGIMGTRELSLAGLADRLRKESAKGGKQA